MVLIRKAVYQKRPRLPEPVTDLLTYNDTL